jgi:hypothetical protein
MSFIRSKLNIILLLSLPLNAFSQSDTTEIVSVADTGKSAKAGTGHSLYSSLGYGSNMIYLGSTISQNQSFGFTTVTYGFNNELFASASAIHLTNYSPFLPFYNFSLNYGHAFNSWFDISLGLSRYQLDKSQSDTLFSSFSYGDVTLGIDWRLLYSKITAGGLLADENQAFFQFRNSRYFQTPEFFRNKIFVSFDPYINLVFGTLIKAESSTEISYTSSDPFRPKGSGGLSTTATTSSTTLSTNILYSKIFGLMEVEFGLPVSINFDRITIEAGASYVLPTYKSDFITPGGFVFLLSGSFRIF